MDFYEQRLAEMYEDWESQWDDGTPPEPEWPEGDD